MDPSGSIHVTDYGNDRVQTFTSEGVYVSEHGDAGSGPGQFLHPVGIDFDAFGNSCVVDLGNSRVQRLIRQSLQAQVSSFLWSSY